MQKEQDHVVLTPQEARQVRRGFPVFVVLIASMGLVILAFLIYAAVGHPR